MPHSFTRINTILFVLFFVFGLSVFSFGQTNRVQNDLGNSFKKYDLVKFDNQTALRQAQAGNTLTIPTAERNFQLSLTPRDLRAPQYRAENTGVSGSVSQIEKGEITTFKGKISGEESDSEVRLSIDGSRVEGYFISGKETFFVEPASKYSNAASKGDYVVYRKEDAINQSGFTCDVSDKIERGRELLAVQGVQSPQNTRVIEIATESDFEFVTALGGAGAANNETLNILNMAEGVYFREQNLKISVVYQHTWTMPDPYANTTTSTLLVSFKDYWNANFPASQIPRDTVHLFSGKPTVAGQGLAYIGVVCSNQAFAYGMSGRIDFAPIKFELTAHEIGHNLGASHVDATQNCDNTLMNMTITPLTQFSFCSYSQTQLTTYVSSNNSCLSIQNNSKNRFDFDGDNRADIAVFRPTNGVWYITNSGSGAFNFVQFGARGDKPVAADYDGDGKADIAVYRSGNWYRLKSTTNTFDGVGFGNASDIPVPADYDGDGKADTAVFRPASGEWFILKSSNNGFQSIQFGADSDVPLPSDFDGDGRADINIWRPSSGVWYRLNSGSANSFSAAQFGANGDKPIAGDFDGDGKADLVVFRPSNGVWYELKSLDGSIAGIGFGQAGDVPAAADYDGDGKTDVSVFRPSNGYWYRLNSTNGAFASVQFGASDDMPNSAAY